MIKVLKQAIEALESYYGYMAPLTKEVGGRRVPIEQSTTDKVGRAIASLNQTISHLKKQAPKSEWVGLTDEEMLAAIRPLYTSDSVAQNALEISKDEYRAIEAALKEKNHDTL
jgi:type IV secretory pathway protease TraF